MRSSSRVANPLSRKPCWYTARRARTAADRPTAAAHAPAKNDTTPRAATSPTAVSMRVVR